MKIIEAVRKGITFLLPLAIFLYACKPENTSIGPTRTLQATSKGNEPDGAESIDLDAAVRALSQMEAASDDIGLHSIKEDLATNPKIQTPEIHLVHWHLMLSDKTWNALLVVPTGTEAGSVKTYSGVFYKGMGGRWCAMVVRTGGMGGRGSS